MGTEEEIEQRKHEFAMTLIRNHAEKALAAHQENRPYFFSKGMPFYTEMKGEGMYTKEFPDGGISAVRCHFHASGAIDDEPVSILVESPMSTAQEIGKVYTHG